MPLDSRHVSLMPVVLKRAMSMSTSVGIYSGSAKRLTELKVLGLLLVDI